MLKDTLKKIYFFFEVFVNTCPKNINNKSSKADKIKVFLDEINWRVLYMVTQEYRKHKKKKKKNPLRSGSCIFENVLGGRTHIAVPHKV